LDKAFKDPAKETETIVALRETISRRAQREKPLNRFNSGRKCRIMNKNQDKGFTLVELLIVIVILGILATVTVFAVRGITSEAQTNACDTEVKTVQTAAQAYFASNPATLTLGADAAASMTTLVDAGLLAEASTTTSVAPDGTVAKIGDCL